MPTPRGVYGEGAALLTLSARPAPPRRYPPRHLPAVTRVSIGYTFPEPFGHAEVGYSFEVGLLVPLESGYVVPVERLQPGMRFVLDNGAIGTVTEVGQPKVWEPPPPEPDADGNYVRRVLGRIKHTGFMVLDLSFAGQTITTTPGHLFYSLDRRGWVGAETLHVGESLLNDKGERLRLDGRSRIRHGFVDLYNIEVEQFHTYLVGRSPGGAVLAHNGVPGPGGPGYIPKPAALKQADKEALAVRVADAINNSKPLPAEYTALNLRTRQRVMQAANKHIDEGLRHGNSAASAEPVIGYRLESTVDGSVQKYGITKDFKVTPDGVKQSRYSQEFLDQEGLRFVPLRGEMPRTQGLGWERSMINSYFRLNGEMPPRNPLFR
jgi:hypothetical protein